MAPTAKILKGARKKENARSLTRKRLEAVNGPASPITPRRKLLIDQLTTANQSIAQLERDVTKRDAKLTKLEAEQLKCKENNINLVERVDTLSRKLHNKTRQAGRAKVAAEQLRLELRRSKHARVVQSGRLQHRKDTGLAKALKQARVGIGKCYMKGKGGVFTERSREMVRDLVGCNVATSNVDRVIHIVGAGLGIPVQDHISARHVGRIVEEGGIASDLQVTHEMKTSGAVTISGDGTTIRHINYEAKHVTMYLPGSSEPVTRMLDITSAPNHTSEEQLAGWKATMYQSLSGTYNASPLGSNAPLDPAELVSLIKGVGADHAPDQQKFVRLTNIWTTDAKKIMMGKRYLSSAQVQEYLPSIARANHEKIEAAGGLDAWMALPEEEKLRRDAEVYERLCREFGEKEWLSLSPEQRNEAEVLVFCGCCMHKEMNSVKGGCRALKLFWESVGGPGPVKLMNKAHSAAASNSAEGSAANSHAQEESEGGAIKLTSLMGALFNHKDDKRGSQETFNSYFEEFLGYRITCPDTSNTRFQSHADCAVFIMLYLPQILSFMSHISYSKQKVSLNHMESNVLKGLKDIPTLTELAVLALYAISVSYAYMHVVRATGDRRRNALDLGPFHTKVIEFCERVADNTDLLLAPDASYKTGTLDGKVWEHPDVFYAVQRLIPSLPHISGCLRAFMIGAADKWKDFTTEFAADGAIAQLSAASRAKIYINPTNDHNEGALGRLRRAIREAIRLALSHHNAKTKYTVNNTRDFLRSKLVTDAVRVWLRAEARRRVDSGREKKRRLELVAVEKAIVAEKKEKQAERVAQAAARQAELDNIVPLLDSQWIKANHKQIKVTDLVLQINWHRQFTEKGIIPMKTLITKMSKEDKVIQLIIAVDRYNRDILPRLDALARAAVDSGLDATAELPIESTWEEMEEMEEEDMLDDY